MATTAESLARRRSYLLGSGSDVQLSVLLSPAIVLIVVSLLSVTASALIPAPVVVEFTGGLSAPSRAFIAAQLALIAAMLVGAVVGLTVQTPEGPIGVRIVTRDSIARAGMLVGVLTLIGYAALSGLAALRGYTPSLAASVLEGDPSALRASRKALAPVGGVTTLVALSGPTVAALVSSGAKLRARHIAMLVALLAGATCRAFLNAERLALVEFLVPLLIALAFRPGVVGLTRRVVATLGLGLVSSVGLFALGEWIRPSYTSRSGEIGFSDYIQQRLVGYYVSSNINGEYYVDQVRAIPAPNYTADVIWNLPGLRRIVTPQTFYGFDSSAGFRRLLDESLNPELNTVAFLPSVYAEWGLPLGCILVAAITFYIARNHSLFTRSITLGAGVYSMLAIGALESTRYPYFAQARFWVAMFGLGLIYVLATKFDKRAADAAT